LLEFLVFESSLPSLDRQASPAETKFKRTEAAKPQRSYSKCPLDIFISAKFDRPFIVGACDCSGRCIYVLE